MLRILTASEFQNACEFLSFHVFYFKSSPSPHTSTHPPLLSWQMCPLWVKCHWWQEGPNFIELSRDKFFKVKSLEGSTGINIKEKEGHSPNGYWAVWPLRIDPLISKQLLSMALTPWFTVLCSGEMKSWPCSECLPVNAAGSWNEGACQGVKGIRAYSFLFFFSRLLYLTQPRCRCHFSLPHSHCTKSRLMERRRVEKRSPGGRELPWGRIF